MMKHADSARFYIQKFIAACIFALRWQDRAREAMECREKVLEEEAALTLRCGVVSDVPSCTKGWPLDTW